VTLTRLKRCWDNTSLTSHNSYHLEGKGFLQTYWCEPHAKSRTSNTSDSDVDRSLESAVLDDGLRRLVDWNVEILARSLTLITSQRQADSLMRGGPDRSDSTIQPEGCAIDEVTEIIELPAFDSNFKKDKGDGKVELAPDILKQLHTYVTAIASMYRNNPFHNFEHASHVCMSVQVSVIFLYKIRAREYANHLTQPSNAYVCFGPTHRNC